jgi:preprotein translocase subunit SecD
VTQLVVSLAAMSMLVGAAPSGAPASVTPGAIVDVSILIVQLRGADGAPLAAEDLAAASAVIEDRLAALSAPGTQVSLIPGDRVRIDVGDPAQLDAIRRVATAPGELWFVPVPNEFAAEVVAGAPLPADMPVAPIFDGSHVERASMATDQMGEPAVDFQLDTEAAELFDAFAADHFGELFAMVLDDIVVSAATINATNFDGRAQISGSLDEQAATEWVAILSGGVLPVVAEAIDVCPAPAGCAIESPLPAASAAP